MKNEIAITKNVRDFLLAVDKLSQRATAVEGMCLLHGAAGEGKTTATAYVVNRVNGIYVRASVAWTVTAMLSGLMHELGAAPLQRRQPMLEYISGRLKETRQPVFIDEADYLCRKIDMLDAARDLYDMARVPVVLIGMEQLPKKLTTHARLRRRITQEVLFQGLDPSDAQILAETVCDVAVTDDLIDALHTESRGNIGLIVNGLATIEALAKSNGWEQVDRSLWGERPFFFGMDTQKKQRSRR